MLDMRSIDECPSVRQFDYLAPLPIYLEHTGITRRRSSMLFASSLRHGSTIKP